MRVLVLGGTGFLGTPLVRQLVVAGHQVTVFHRGGAGCSLGVEGVVHVHGERARLEAMGPALAARSPQVVIDLLAATAAGAKRTGRLVRGSGFGGLEKWIALSSMDVYRACGIFHGSEAGAAEPGLLDEMAPLRRRAGLYPASALERLRGIYGWLEEGYDKVGMERTLRLGVGGVRPIVLRLPQVYGPGDRQHRFYPLLKRMRDQRPAILMARGWGLWRSPRGYVENVAAAIVAALVAARPGAVYNVADAGNFSELEWAQRLAQAMEWRGRFILTAPASTPVHLRVSANTAQHWLADTRRIRRELGYREPVPVAQALAATCVWEREHRPAMSAAEEAAQFPYSAEDQALRALGLAPPFRVAPRSERAISLAG